MFAKIILQKNLKRSRQRRTCVNVVMTRIEHVCVNLNNTVTNVLRKMSENIFSYFGKISKWRTIKFGKKILKPKQNFLH